MSGRDIEFETGDLYRTVFRESNDAVLVFVAESGRILECNPAATDLLGYSREELLTLGPADIHPHEFGAYESFVEYVLDHGGGWTEELSCRTKDGDLIETEISASTCRLDGLRCMVARIRDVSSVRERRRELQRENERLENVANILSHDLRNPLNVALGHVRTALRDGRKADLETAADALERSVEIVDNVSTLARENGTVDPTDLEQVTLEELVRNCWRNVETDEADLVVETDLTFRADPDRLRHVFENLFRNAIEHGAEPGSPGENPSVTIRVGRQQNGFFVSDDGPGTDEDGTRKLFKTGVSSTRDGSGLGLNIVERVVEAHDWTIAVAESESGGARFEVTGLDAGS